jgi:hypothetical protein
MSGPSEKSEKSEKKAKAAAGLALPTGATDLRSRVPGMTDDALVTLQANARRMLEGGNAAQKTAAGDLIPVIEGELAERKAKKLASQPARKTAAPKVRKTKAPKDDGAA